MTKQSLVGHLCWAGVAVAAFAFGSTRDKDSASGEDAKARAAKSSSRLSANDGSGSGSGTAGSKSALSAGRPGSGNSARNSGYDGELNHTMTEEQLAALAKEAFRSGSPLARRQAFGRLLEQLTADNAKDLVKHLKANKADKSEWRDFHYAWGTIDGQAALEHSIKSSDYDLAYTMTGWASAYPDEARSFLQNLPESVKTDRARLQRSLVAGMADNDTNRATAYVLELAGQGAKQAGEYMGIVTEEVLRNFGAQEAATWSENLPDGDLKGAALDSVAHRLTNENPEAAAQWVEQFANEAYGVRAIEEVGDEWAERDPAAAVNWLETLPAGRGQSEGLSSAFGEWARRDAVAAADRISSMPRSEQRDSAISGYSRMLAYKDPGAAINWANSIAQDGLRNSALTRAGQMLFRRDAEAARQWVSTSGLPPEAQQAVLNPPKRR